MRNVTISLDDTVVAKARVAAAKQGKSLSRFVSELVEQRIGRTLTQKQALEVFLSGPPLHVLDENGKAPTTDALYE